MAGRRAPESDPNGCEHVCADVHAVHVVPVERAFLGGSRAWIEFACLFYSSDDPAR
jgi:hypothetical protein